MEVLEDHSHAFANAVVALTGVAYFSAWSISFYPQIILNYRRKKTNGLSPDMIIINPIGHLTLTIWNWGVYFSPLARKQYQRRHDGHQPQISLSDLAFSMHAFVLSTLTLIQVIYYYYRNKRIAALSNSNGDEGDERQPLISDNSNAGNGRPTSILSSASIADLAIPTSTIRPSVPLQISVVAVVVSGLVSGSLVWAGKAEWLDWLYFISTLKLIISIVKYVPQVLLNYRLKSTAGMAISVMLLDLTGSVLSFAQLVVSSIWIEHDPSGIIANPAKLGLAGLSIIFDLIFIVQRYWLYADKREKIVED